MRSIACSWMTACGCAETLTFFFLHNADIKNRTGTTSTVVIHTINMYLVGGFTHGFYFHNIWDNPYHLLIFFRGVETTNQV